MPASMYIETGWFGLVPKRANAGEVALELVIEDRVVAVAARAVMPRADLHELADLDLGDREAVRSDRLRDTVNVVLIAVVDRGACGDVIELEPRATRAGRPATG